MTASQKQLVKEAAEIEHVDMAAWARPIVLKAAEAVKANAKAKRKHG